jgi:hypothetical protein
MKKKVFLGETCNGSTWRDELIPLLTIDYFNPVVDDWTPECQAKEIKERESADFCLYVITPKMKGFYSIAEVVDDSNKRPGKTLFAVLHYDDGPLFDDKQIKSLEAISDMIAKNGGVSICQPQGITNDQILSVVAGHLNSR